SRRFLSSNRCARRGRCERAPACPSAGPGANRPPVPALRYRHAAQISTFAQMYRVTICRLSKTEVGPQRGRSKRCACSAFRPGQEAVAVGRFTPPAQGRMTDTDPNTSRKDPNLSFRAARPTDGAAIWQLVKATGKLELNSAYFYLVFATDFGDTCLVAEQNGRLVGAVIGYHPPRQPDAAFVWQVGVLPDL